jgi:L-seryl-tRNA(Ser) seleniumtransferase
MDKRTAFRNLPAIHRLQHLEAVVETFRPYPQALVTEALADALAALRADFDEAQMTEEQWQREIEPTAIIRRAKQFIDRKFTPELRPVLNLTGTIVHTNLGRAPLSKRALAAVQNVAAGYSNLEYDLNQGSRGSRHTHVEARICALTGAEAALVVNNNAAAVFLALRVMGRGGDGIVSRGQLVEIGGSFRVPDIMKESGVNLVEVGTTNKTKLRDYEAAITEETRLIMRIHTSNYRIIGFTEQPTLQSLVALSHEHQIPVFEDLGSGALFDYMRRGIGDEPTIGQSVAAGVDVVSFSGDKLLGGAQAGILIGKRHWIDQLKRNQLTRALRVDKMTLAALEAVLVAHQDEDMAAEEIPVIHMITEPYADVSRRCQGLCEDLMNDSDIAQVFRITMVDDVSRVGGGSLPEEDIPTRAIRLESNHSPDEVARDLRLLPAIPIVVRTHDDALLLDVRTLLPGQEQILLDGLRVVAQQYLSMTPDA